VDLHQQDSLYEGSGFRLAACGCWLLAFELLASGFSSGFWLLFWLLASNFWLLFWLLASNF